jgi:hypothetical protein
MTTHSEANEPPVYGWQEGIDLGAKPFPELVVRVRNEGNSPVHDVTLRVPVGVRGTFVRELHSLGAGQTQEVRIAIPAPPRSERIATEVTFVDETGRGWLRAANGELSQPENIPPFTSEPGSYKVEDHPTLHLQSEGYTVAN